MNIWTWIVLTPAIIGLLAIVWLLGYIAYSQHQINKITRELAYLQDAKAFTDLVSRTLSTNPFTQPDSGEVEQASEHPLESPQIDPKPLTGLSPTWDTPEAYRDAQEALRASPENTTQPCGAGCGCQVSRDYTKDDLAQAVKVEKDWGFQQKKIRHQDWSP